ncbi:uncharacterized protein LOC119458179 [Dermacentor silvarum]|uniref:uncharacterized protein LOC119458179 n=1 Tax=Dermacentor silvarum TaxID=543639 RepID=UPI002100E9BC|nr:uncharacterized protein LOC119458179 [Dermacentor silvarum]
MAVVRVGGIVCVFILLSSTGKADINAECTQLQHRALVEMFRTLPETYVLAVGLGNITLFPGVRFNHALLTELDSLVRGQLRACVRQRKVGNLIRFKAPINIILPWETSCPGESGNLTVSLAGVQAETVFSVETSDSGATISLVNFYGAKVDSISIYMDGSGIIAHTLMSVVQESLRSPLKSLLLEIVTSALRNMFTEAAKSFSKPV